MESIACRLRVTFKLDPHESPRWPQVGGFLVATRPFQGVASCISTIPDFHMITCAHRRDCAPVEKIEIQVVRDSLQEPLLSMCTSHCLDSLEDILDLRYYHLYLSVYNRLLGSHSQLKSVQMQCRVEWKSVTVGETLKTIHSFSFFLRSNFT